MTTIASNSTRIFSHMVVGHLLPLAKLSRDSMDVSTICANCSNSMFLLEEKYFGTHSRVEGEVFMLWNILRGIGWVCPCEIDHYAK